MHYAFKNIMMSTKKKYSVKFRLWFYADDDKFLGKGRVELLERIKETGSITNAAKGMKMSYRQAWQMVKEMNERGNSVFVEKHLGGKSGGGATITDAGEQLIKQYHELIKKVQIFITDESKKLNF